MEKQTKPNYDFYSKDDISIPKLSGVIERVLASVKQYDMVVYAVAIVYALYSETVSIAYVALFFCFVAGILRYTPWQDLKKRGPD